MLEAIKQERREIDTLGYIRSAASRLSEGPLSHPSVMKEVEVRDEESSIGAQLKVNE